MTSKILTAVPMPVRFLVITDALISFARCFRKLPTTLAHRGQLQRLAEYDDHVLADIGVMREDINAALSARFWRDPSAELVRRLGNLKADPRCRPTSENARETGRPAISSPELILAACNRRRWLSQSGV
jgi:uncharacterized protein YjiS (DUF1127 family)